MPNEALDCERMTCRTDREQEDFDYNDHHNRIS